jgi:predicted glycosyltransferase
MRLASAYRRRHPEAAVLVVTGSHRVGALAFPRGVDYLKLPSIAMVDRYENWTPRDLSLSMTRVTRLRADLIRQAVRRFAPDLLVADFMPAGPYGELLPALKELRRRGRPAIAGFRDIIDEPDFVRALWERTEIYSVLREHYAAICVYGAREVVDFERDYGLDRELARRLHYVGYLAERPAKGPSPTVSEPFVLACAGGGVDGVPLLRAFIEASARLRPQVGRRWLLIAGPLLDDRSFRELRQDAAAVGVEVKRSVGRLGRLVAQADSVVSMTGYNTSCELLACSVPAVIVPRDGPSQEQRLRAADLVRRRRALMIDPLELDGHTLSRAISHSLTAAPPQRVELPLDGVQAALDLFDAVIERPELEPRAPTGARA